MKRIAEDYGKEFWYYSIEEQQSLINVYRNKENA
jgi:hypothetical protein